MQDGRRSMIRPRVRVYIYTYSIHIYEGEFPRDARIKERGRRAREIETRGCESRESESERSRKHRLVLFGNCTMACRRGSLMATMQIPIPVANVSDFVEERASPRTRFRVSDRAVFWAFLVRRVNSPRQNLDCFFPNFRRRGIISQQVGVTLRRGIRVAPNKNFIQIGDTSYYK